MASGGTAGRSAISPGTRMPGPGSGGSELFATVGSGPKGRSGSGAGAQGGPAKLVVVLAGFGAGAMAGRNGAGWDGCISPRLPPCQPPAGGPHGACRGGGA